MYSYNTIGRDASWWGTLDPHTPNHISECFHTVPPYDVQINPEIGLCWGGSLKGMLWALPLRCCTITQHQRSREFCFFFFSVDYCGVTKGSGMNCEDCNIACQKDILGGCSLAGEILCYGLFTSAEWFLVSSRELARAVSCGELWVLSPLLVGFCAALQTNMFPVRSQISLCLG